MVNFTAEPMDILSRMWRHARRCVRVSPSQPFAVTGSLHPRVRAGCM
jgi:hypothetical protein